MAISKCGNPIEARKTPLNATTIDAAAIKTLLAVLCFELRESRVKMDDAVSASQNPCVMENQLTSGTLIPAALNKVCKAVKM
ncbi:hypothetical protein OIPHN260_04940 [Enterobacter roggenkampii]|uniref:Uncharacterized protein n=1 Tax=Enterobacter roggenkampii TaxID=1812935 RepID=A0AAU9BMU9_9ENTR|nr:hypothetical protein OIPHN260_04940 [Enterobacter roggenkampii]